MDAATANGAEVTVGFRPELMLDSQVVTYLQQWIDRSTRLSGTRRESITNLIRFAVERRIGYNPAFYYLESFRNADTGDVEFARRTARAILLLHTMDDLHFLATGEVRTSEAVLELYRSDYGCATFEETVEAYSQGFIREASQAMNLGETGGGRLRYATLLRIAAIHRRRPATSWVDLSKKCEQFDDFLGEIGRIEMPLERLVAVSYFSGKIEQFLPVQRGANLDKVFARIKAAVWDLQFLSMPGFLLAQQPDFGVVVAYPCTADRCLGYLAGMFTFELVISQPAATHPLPVLGFRDPFLRRAFAIRGQRRPWQVRTSRLSESDLNSIITEEERTVRELCRT